MSDKTMIEWTDATWNPIVGCSVISPGCTNCYAMKLAGTRMKNHPTRQGLTDESKAGPVWNGQVRFNEKELLKPLSWRKPRKIFVCAHSDLFQEAVPDEWIDKVFAIMALCPQHTFQVLTKRPERMREHINRNRHNGCGFDKVLGGELLHHYTAVIRRGIKVPVFALPLPNVWLGVSVEDQSRADERIPVLLATPATKRFVSAEPLLGPVDLPQIVSREGEIFNSLSLEEWAAFPDAPEVKHTPGAGNLIDWVIVGGESGTGARPMHPNWVRSLRDQCKAADVPFFFKQWGEWAPQIGAIDLYDFEPQSKYRWAAWDDDVWDYWDRPSWCDDLGAAEDCCVRVGKRRAGADLDGVEHREFPDAP